MKRIFTNRRTPGTVSDEHLRHRHAVPAPYAAFTFEFTQKDMDSIRDLRLHHWALYLKAYRKWTWWEFWWPKRAKQFRDTAQLHLGWVQFLNDFFELGDNAEQDLANLQAFKDSE